MKLRASDRHPVLSDLTTTTTTTDAPFEIDETIALWSKILPAIILAILIVYFVCVFFYFKRRIQTNDELVIVPSYYTPGAVESPVPRQFSASVGSSQSRLHSFHRATMSTETSEAEMDFSFRPTIRS